MINKNIRIIFFGSSSYVIPIIETLQRNFDFKLAVTTEKTDAGPITSYCKNANLECINITNSKDPSLKNKIKKSAPVIGVVADFGLIITKDVLNIFPKGIINIHPSLLPVYRGPTPVQSSILNGDKKTGLSIIKIDEKVDHGPILFQTEEPIKDTDTSQSLYERLFRAGAQILPKIIDNYLNGEMPKDQNHTRATFTKTLCRGDGYIDINNPPAKNLIDRMIRAYYPWPGVWTKFKTNNKTLRVKLLPDKKLQAEGKKPIGYKDFFNGYPEAEKYFRKLYF